MRWSKVLMWATAAFLLAGVIYVDVAHYLKSRPLPQPVTRRDVDGLLAEIHDLEFERDAERAYVRRELDAAERRLKAATEAAHTHRAALVAELRREMAAGRKAAEADDRAVLARVEEEFHVLRDQVGRVVELVTAGMGRLAKAEAAGCKCGPEPKAAAPAPAPAPVPAPAPAWRLYTDGCRYFWRLEP